MAAAKPRKRAPKDLAEAPLPGLEALEPAAASSRGEESPHAGHRRRLQQRLLEGGPGALQDYELLELVLCNGILRRDVKPLAKELLATFGGLWQVFNAPTEKLRRVKVGAVSMDSDFAVASLRVVAAAATRAMKAEVMKKPVLSSWNALIDYLTVAMAHEPVEQFRLLFLDRKNALIADEVQQRGTIDHTPVYPREVVKRALELGASALILVHNHPSGDPTPSRADIDMTKEIGRAAQAVGVILHDHIIVGKGKHSSFKGMGLL
ncbi:DNA repair protein RadC [Azospirillum sp. RWY-5-1]|uniref:DNA repair protein RadC n=1 Tax=Azospirillum oleiclasticum TaxID=2735135 RepID=A0ABX2TGZ1_9PROT|nr:DNA repair protein RadC [Azospirillum oleiclasticum]NYZ14630.1 DNA repair protein RadC [Azospirillum oleiclasticum]NYZ22383.1 DNA repair protein RadC [Azospirillum oleiclasticum]